jgi:hypothetical protein
LAVSALAGTFSTDTGNSSGYIDHNHDLKGLFKSTAAMAIMRPGPFREFYLGLLAKGMSQLWLVSRWRERLQRLR